MRPLLVTAYGALRARTADAGVFSTETSENKFDALFYFFLLYLPNRLEVSIIL